MATVSPDSVAQDQIKAFVERIMRLREEAKAINGDIREVYAEAKGNGFDKTVLGKVVNYIEKRATSAGELAEGEALFDLYLAAFDGATRVGTGIATHTHEAAGYDRLTGEVRDETSRHGAGGAEDEAAVANVAAPSSAQPIQAETPTSGEAREAAAAGESPAIQGMRANAGGENVADRPVHVSEEPGHGAASVNAPAEGDTNSATIPHPAEGNTPTSAAAGDRGAVIPSATPVVIPSAGVDANAAAVDRSGQGSPGPSNPAPVAPTNVTAFRTHNPETHFLNSEGLPRLHGCLKAELCGSAEPRKRLCVKCSVAHDGPTPQVDGGAA